MNGFELAEKIRGHYPALPIAALTGHAEREFQEKALAFRLNGYLTKPIKREHFQNLFETVFGNRFCFEERTNWRVLLIHEKSEERQSLLQAFSARFPRVKLQSAENGVPGLVMLGGFAPDLLLLSSGLTDMDPAVVLKFLSGNSRYRNLACLVLTPTEQFLPEYQRFLELNAAAVLPHSAHHHRVLSAASKYYAAAARSAGAMPGSAPYSLTGSLSRELGMSAEDYHEIANHFFANAQESIRQLATLGLTNHAESARITHALKGNALSLRLFAAVSIIKQVDAALALKKEDMLKKALDNLNSMIMCLDKALSNPKN
jgi:CheY-like chemotaxis protein